MRAMFGVVGLLVVVVIVGMLAKKQLGSLSGPAAVPATAGAPGTTAPLATQPAANPQQQVQQFKQAAEAAVQQPRAVDDSK
jgi:hypothetical protein